MYSNKINVLELLSLLKKHVTSVVLCPGSRNIPLVQSMANDPDFTCYSITDERSAGFFALGLALKLQQPVAVCCTSGSALLNLHPAVSEAFYQQVPLLVLSADRPEAWIGQMDGQTLPQAKVFNSLVKHAVNLPEIKTQQDLWFCNRLINEALLALHFQTPGPVHINIPIGEPFFSFEVSKLPESREIQRFEPYQFFNLVAHLQDQLKLQHGLNHGLTPGVVCGTSGTGPCAGTGTITAADPATPEALKSKSAKAAESSEDTEQAPDSANTASGTASGTNAGEKPYYHECDQIHILAQQSLAQADKNPHSALVEACRMLVCHYPKIMLLIGQNGYETNCLANLSAEEKQLLTKNILIVEESISNLGLEHTCDNIDRTLLLPQVQADTELYPQVLITCGGHIISKRLKHYLREHQPKMHWHIAADGAVIDLYHCLSHILVCRPSEFIKALIQALSSMDNLNKAGCPCCGDSAPNATSDSSAKSTRGKAKTKAKAKAETAADAADTADAAEHATGHEVSASSFDQFKAVDTGHLKSLSYVRQWLFYSQQVFAPTFPYSQMHAIGLVIENLPAGSVLHLANSSTVRYAQLFKMPRYQGSEQIQVMSNRGVNGIEGSLSTAIGYAAADPNRLNFIMIGDLSFFYDLNALWNSHITGNVRIMLLNNGGGEIFHALPNLKLSPQAQHFVTATHQTTAQGWVESQGFTYLPVRNQAQLHACLDSFMQPLPSPAAQEGQAGQAGQGQDGTATGAVSEQGPSCKPVVMEVFTDQDDDTKILKNYMRQLQNLN